MVRRDCAFIAKVIWEKVIWNPKERRLEKSKTFRFMSVPQIICGISILQEEGIDTARLKRYT